MSDDDVAARGRAIFERLRSGEPGNDEDAADPGPDSQEQGEQTPSSGDERVTSDASEHGGAHEFTPVERAEEAGMSSSAEVTGPDQPDRGPETTVGSADPASEAVASDASEATTESLERDRPADHELATQHTEEHGGPSSSPDESGRADQSPGESSQGSHGGIPEGAAGESPEGGEGADAQTDVASSLPTSSPEQQVDAGEGGAGIGDAGESTDAQADGVTTTVDPAGAEAVQSSSEAASLDDVGSADAPGSASPDSGAAAASAPASTEPRALPGATDLPDLDELDPSPEEGAPAAPEAEQPSDEPEPPEPASPFARPLPRVMAVANQKGGVGKTTTSVNLGACLADLGYRVLVVDLDPQGNASTGLGINIRDLQGSMYDVILHDLPIEDCVEATSVRNLFCAPSSLDLAGAEIELVPAFSRELRLKRALEEVHDDYDFILIDCPPSLGLLTVNGLAAATEVVVPIQCEYYALEGLGQLLRNVNLVQRNLNPILEVSAIVLVMYDARTKLADQVVTEVRDHFGAKVCRNVIPRTVRLSEAPSFGQPIIAFDPTSRGAIAYRELAKEVSGGTPQRAG